MKEVYNKGTSILPLFLPLSQIISGEIDCSYETCNLYSTDNSQYKVTPQAVIFPKNVRDIKNIISFSHENKIPVTIRGGGTSSSGSSLCEGIIIDMKKHFNNISQINKNENTVTVGSGVKVEDLINFLTANGFDIPLLSYSSGEETIGGVFATKSVTSSSFLYGTIREWVECVSVVLDNGEEHLIKDGITPSGRLLGIYQEVFPYLTRESPHIRASRPDNNEDSTGFNIWNNSIGPRQLLDQLCGSEGTLGIITSITIRIVPKMEHIQSTLFYVDKNLLITCVEISKKHNAKSIFLLDETQMSIISNKYPNIINEKNIPSSYALLIIHNENDIKILTSEVNSFIKALPIEKEKIFSLDNLASKKILSSLFTNSLLSEYSGNSRAVVTTMSTIIVPFFNYIQILNDIDSYILSTGRIYTVSGYIGSGHISLLVLFDSNSITYANDVATYTDKIVQIVKKYKGGISAYGGDGIARTPYLPNIFNDTTMSIFIKLKKMWDPNELFNPGKKTTANLNYAKKHTINNIVNDLPLVKGA